MQLATEFSGNMYEEAQFIW